ncbi:MAG TPA: cupredoxin domain-containing protein [Rudaea sp.]|nr:cupredoxin domain-containing protein [Rudaea sp.]
MRKQIRTIIICSMIAAKNSISGAILGAGLMLAAGTVCAEDYDAKLVIRDHKFEPVELTVPAGQKIKLLVDNQDATPEEFESNELNREKIVTGKGTITVFLGPLDAGRYPFFGDFHQETAQGVLIVK